MLKAMQFGKTLDCILQEILLAKSFLGLVSLMKLDISDGFYHIAINVDDIPKLEVTIPTTPGAELTVCLPICFTNWMGKWKQLPT